MPKVDGMMDFRHLILSVNRYNKFLQKRSLLTLHYSKDQENGPAVGIVSELNCTQPLLNTNHYLHTYLTI